VEEKKRMKDCESFLKHFVNITLSSLFCPQLPLGCCNRALQILEQAFGYLVAANTEADQG
jgi:hypothetical protein